MPQPGIEPWREESEPKPDDGTYVKSVSHAQIRGVYKEMGVTLRSARRLRRHRGARVTKVTRFNREFQAGGLQ